MLVYHGSPNQFDKFDLTKSNGMIWLTTNQDYASQFGSVKSYDLSLNNPLDMSNRTTEMPIEMWQDILSGLGININDIDWDVVDFAPDYGYYTFYDLLPHCGNNYADAGTLDAIKDAGYDGIIAPEEFCEGISSETTYCAFNTKCLK